MSKGRQHRNIGPRAISPRAISTKVQPIKPVVEIIITVDLEEKWVDYTVNVPRVRMSGGGLQVKTARLGQAFAEATKDIQSHLSTYHSDL